MQASSSWCKWLIPPEEARHLEQGRVCAHVLQLSHLAHEDLVLLFVALRLIMTDSMQKSAKRSRKVPIFMNLHASQMPYDRVGAHRHDRCKRKTSTTAHLILQLVQGSFTPLTLVKALRVLRPVGKQQQCLQVWCHGRSYLCVRRNWSGCSNEILVLPI